MNTLSKRKVAEMKAPGDRGTIARARKTLSEAADILRIAGDLVRRYELTKTQRTALARQLHKGATRLHTMAFLSRSGAEVKKLARKSKARKGGT